MEESTKNIPSRLHSRISKILTSRRSQRAEWWRDSRYARRGMLANHSARWLRLLPTLRESSV